MIEGTDGIHPVAYDGQGSGLVEGWKGVRVMNTGGDDVPKTKTAKEVDWKGRSIPSYHEHFLVEDT